MSGPVTSGRAVVIGAGFGGLAVGIRLQAAGWRVTIVEALEQPGGRASQHVEQGYTFDMGPTLITAPHLLRELWDTFGGRLEDDLELIPLEPYYRIYFPDGAHFDASSDVNAMEREIARFNPADVDAFRAFLTDTRRIYERAFEDLAREPFHRFSSFAAIVPELLRLGAVRSVYSYTSRYFQDARLRTIFSFHPLFIGGSPLRSSAIYSIIPYLERLGGVHFARGGMSALVSVMARRFRILGGELRLNSPVRRIVVERGRARGVELGGGRIPADAVISNADVTKTYLELLPRRSQKLFDRARYRTYQHSMSCYLIYLGLSRQYPQLQHHTVIMPDGYQRMIGEVFDGNRLPTELALYLHTPTRTDPSLAPPGGESMYVLAPVPHLKPGIPPWRQLDRPFRDRIVRYLEHDFGLEQLERSIVVERHFTPADFASRLRSWRGAAFSIEPTLTQSAYFRPHNRQSDIPGLYLVGAGTHPGAGLPGTLLSAELTAGLILNG